VTWQPHARPADVTTVAVVGAGLIGAGWTAYFLARGLDVRVYDPSIAAAGSVKGQVLAMWPAMVAAGIAKSAGLREPIVCRSLEDACSGAGFVQENGPERVELKRALMAQIDAALPPGVVIASSSSSLLPSNYQGDAATPARILAAHPFNPPSLVPLVEIAGGALTAPEAIDWTIDFFRRIGKAPVKVRREVPGYIANRMAAALYREAVHLVASGVASVADVDAAIVNGPGLRWAVMGPHMLYHLGGGPGGYAHYLDHLGPAQEARWATLETAPLDATLKVELVTQLQQELTTLAGRDPAMIRDEGITSILAMRRR
jgi:3-hydroxyacyl-CoA dehydrogenase